MFVPDTCLGCFILVAFSTVVLCQTKINQPPWVRPEAMPEILFKKGAPPQILRVPCPTVSGDYANVTWWRGEEFIAAGRELVFRPLEYHHTGEYQCKAKSAAGVSVSRVLEVREVFLEKNPSTVQRLFVMDGQAASIPCGAPEGYPHPVVSWNSSKSDHAIPMIVDPEGTLHLPFISRADHGSILECSAEQLGETYAIKTVELVVYPRPLECIESPHFLYVSQDVYLKKYSETPIYCVPSGPPTPITWTLPSGAKAAVNNDANYVLRINSSTLATKERGFAVSCDRDGLQTVISVNLASEPIILPMKNLSKLEGERVFLKCHASGKPKPRIEWFFNGNPVDKSNIVDDVVVLPNVTLKDMGVYRCDAVNLHGRAYQEVALSVNKAEPHILVDTICFETIVGQRLSIPCETLAFREPMRSWFKNGKFINVTQNDETLEFMDVQLNDAGRYACRVCEKQQHISCATYKFEVKVSPSRFLETPKKPIVVFEGEPLNISCIPHFSDDVILWRIDDKLVQRGQTLRLERPVAGTYSCELHRKDWNGPVTHWDGTVSVRKIAPKLRITEISCTGEGFASLKWMPLEDVAFYEVLHLADSQAWETLEIVKNDSAARIKLGPCSLCRFRVKAQYETRSLISDIRECLPPPSLEREDTRLLVSNVTVSREEQVFHVNWTSAERRKSCHRVCALPGTCLETYETSVSFGFNNVSIESLFTLSKCNSSKAKFPVAASTRETYYNCDLKLHITELRQIQLNSVEVFWEFASDPCCALIGQLEAVGYRTENVDLKKKRFRLDDIENNRLYCLELRAFHGDHRLRGTSASQSCFVSGQGWQVLGNPFFELRNDIRRIFLPNDTALFHSVNGRFEPWPPNATTVDLRELGETSIKFVRKTDGQCRVSDMIFLNDEKSADWYLWLCGSVIVVGGVAITAAVLFRKRSLFYETGYV